MCSKCITFEEKTMSKTKLGRKPVYDKKIPIRFFLEKSIVKQNGGENSCKELCLLYLKNRATK
jgi:hypothetical protein